ncbi:MAG TPA: hypothetical protein VKA78_12645 [Pyrinomonadaceae bacterium]|nr:hypothetical protein [Pyrinomonadaceae bacterium]
MIDWGRAGALLASIDSKADVVATDAARVVAASPRFQNKDFPLSPLPLTVAAAKVEEHRRTAERYMALLERVLGLYAASADVRSYFALTEDEENLARVPGTLTPLIRISRLDGYLKQADARICFLENNTDCPAGILFTERLNLMLDRIINDVNPQVASQLVELPLDRTDCARQELLAAYRQQGGDKDEPVIAVLQISGRSNVESMEMAEEFSNRGTPTFVADPREVAVSAGGVEVGGRQADIIWNKVNTVYWNQLVGESPALLKRWLEAVTSGRVCHINPFSARYVTESKSCAAFLQEAEFADHFDQADREFLQSVLPWSRKVKTGKVVEYGGEQVEITELLLSRPADFVIKEPYDIRGDGVTIGRGVPRDYWVEKVKLAAREGYTAQEFITGQTYPVLLDTAKMEVALLTASLDSFMFGGRLCGLGSKAGLGYKVNVFQGGRKLAVRVYDSRKG